MTNFIILSKKGKEVSNLIDLNLCKNELQALFSMYFDLFGLTCAIYDKNCDLIAYTASYEKTWGTKVYKPPIERIFQVDHVINTSPGEKDICKGCSCFQNCPASFEISQCVYCNGIPVAVLLFVSFSKNKKLNTQKKINDMMALIQKCANFINTILSEKFTHQLSSSRPFFHAMLKINPQPLFVVTPVGELIAENEAFRILKETSNLPWDTPSMHFLQKMLPIFCPERK